MSNGLGSLVKTIIQTCPVKDRHLEQVQENWIIDMGPVHLSKSFCCPDHIGPEPIVKEEVWIDIPPPLIMGSLCILSSFHDSMIGILGDLQFSVSISTSRNKEGNYLERQRVMSLAQHWSMNPFVETLDVPEEPTHGQLDNRLPNLFPKDWRTNDRVLHVGHSRSSACLR